MAGDQGALGVGDNVNFESVASEQYDTLGKRGDVYIASIIRQVFQLRQYDDQINAVAQQLDHTLTIAPYSPAL
jgi:hypothetical protein